MAPTTRSQSAIINPEPLLPHIPTTTTTAIIPKSPIKKKLKRSASVASLPTPPRTRRNPRPSRSSRSSNKHSDSDTEQEEEKSAYPSPSKKDDKRRRVGASEVESVVRVEEEDEDAFWMGDAGANSSSKPAQITTPNGDSDKAKAPVEGDDVKGKRVELRSPSPEPLSLEQKRAMRAQSSASFSLASPPPSRRHPPAPKRQLPPPPVTPKKQIKTLTKCPPLLRDSPDNPFLSSDEEGEEGDLPLLVKAKEKNKVEDKGEGKALSLEEKPTITYVFRGKKAKFTNPHYVPPNESPASKERREFRSKLPLDHPDYSPDTRCPPRRLFTSRITARSQEKKGKDKEKEKKKGGGGVDHKPILISKLPTIHSDEEGENEISSTEEEDEEDVFGATRVAKRLFVDGVGKGSVDAGMAQEKTEFLVVRGKEAA